MFERPSEAEAARYAPPFLRIGAHPPMKRLDGILASVAQKIRTLGAPLESPRPSTSTTAVSRSVRPRRGGAVGVVVQPSARETFSPGELTAAYEDFVASGPRYVDAESGIEGSAYRFGTRVLVVYDEHETGVTILIHPTPLADTTKEPYANASDRRRVGMVKNVSALDAYRGGELPLPPGYKIEHGADVLLLRREEGSVVAAFSARGATPEEVKRTAWDDHRQRSNTA